MKSLNIRLLCTVVALLLGSQRLLAGDGKIHILIVCDMAGNEAERARRSVNEHMARTALESTLVRQGFGNRGDLLVMDDEKATPEAILDYYRNITVGPDDTLLFYCNCHGGMNKEGKHFMQFRRKRLAREKLLAAMQVRSPRLIVLLTDCCSSVSHETPPNAERSSVRRPLTKPAQTTMSATARQLLFEHRGVVNITAAAPGEVARGTVRDGNYFTRAWTALLNEPPARIDRNRDGFVEWSEFYQAVRTRTRTIAEHEGFEQTATANSLARPGAAPVTIAQRN